jgi:DNA recombination protein RmuC
MSDLWPFDPALLTIDTLLLVGLLLLIGLVIALVSLLSHRRRVKDLLTNEHEIGQLREALAAEKVRAERLTMVEGRLSVVTEERDGYLLEAQGLEAELKATREAHQARLEELRGMKTELEDRFGALASGVLESNSKTFLGLVSERFEKHKADADQSLAKRQEAIQSLVKPLDERLGKFDTRIGEIEKQRQEAYGAIQAQVKALQVGQQTLGQETRKLVQALRAPKTRGRWGEMQLKQVFEMAGMAEHVDFELESHMETDNGARRPDAIVHIPGGRSIVVDAKTPLEAYLDAIEADTPEKQAEHLLRHSQHVKTHVRLLASKDYAKNLQEAPDFVVMFIPGESFVAAAAEADPGLIEYAFDNKVLIASPTTLMALVKAIAYGWQQEKMARNVVEVQKLAKEIYDRLVTFGGHLEKVGRSLGQSVNAYNSAVASLEGRVLPSTRKFEALGVVPEDSQMPEVRGVDAETRNLSAAEFLIKDDRDSTL